MRRVSPSPCESRVNVWCGTTGSGAGAAAACVAIAKIQGSAASPHRPVVCTSSLKSLHPSAPTVVIDLLLAEAAAGEAANGRAPEGPGCLVADPLADFPPTWMPREEGCCNLRADTLAAPPTYDEELGHVPDRGILAETAAPRHNGESGQGAIYPHQICGAPLAVAAAEEVVIVPAVRAQLGARDGAEVVGVELSQVAKDQLVRCCR